MTQLAVSHGEWNIDEYLEMEDESPIKHEFLDGQVWAMAGAPEDHNAVCGNTIALLHALIRGQGCRMLTSDSRIYVPRPRKFFTYPDGGVVCGKSEHHPKAGRKMVLMNPSLLFEVLSPRTAKYDRGTKLMLYRQIESCKDVLLIDPATRSVEHHQRGPRGWKAPVRKQRGAISVLGGKIRVADLFEGVEA